MASRLFLRMFSAAVFAALIASAPGPAAAQDLGRVATPILTLDRDRLYSDTAYGQRVSRDLEAASAKLAAETRAIESALEEEEKALTEKRATLAVEEFRALANAFDEKVQALRAEREQAQSNMRAQGEAAQLDFFNRIGPILGQLVRERGAVLIVDRRAILLAANDVDVTQDAIALIDAVLGDGTAPAAPAPESAPAAGTGLDTIPAPAEVGTPATPGDTAQ